MLKISFLATLLLTISINGIAQQQPTPSPPPEEKLPVIREEVTVTATRDGLSQETSPNATSVVTSQENQIRNTSTVDQSLNLLPGVFAFRAKGLADNEARIMIRGFSGQNRTLILFDGQPINDGQSGNVLWTMIPTSEVDRVEVARGPFSALYGGNAMGGVVNIQTRPIDRRSFEGSVQYGTFDTTSYDARYSDRLWDRFGFSVGYRRLQTGGYATRPISSSATTGTTGTLVTGIIPTLTTTGTQSYLIGESGNEWLNQHALRFKGDFTITKKTQISGQFMRQIRANGYDAGISFVRDAAGNAINQGPVLFNENGIIRRFNFTPGSFQQGPGDAKVDFYNASVLHKFNERTFLQISGGVNNQPDVTFRTPTAATATASGGPGSINLRASRNIYFNTQFNWQPGFLGGRNSFVFGTETRADQSDNKDC
ncbi:MAG: TonB-dependent receptor plug domain-containing protein [Blastocatellia bacterium]|nr:TonB-dependent receptor plug domain-containing protein [Blastocatellia bacterium]